MLKGKLLLIPLEPILVKCSKFLEKLTKKLASRNLLGIGYSLRAFYNSWKFSRSYLIHTKSD